MNAAKLYFTIVGKGINDEYQNNNHMQNQQNNYIQIKGYIFTEEMVNILPKNLVEQISEFASNNQGMILNRA